MPGVPGTWGVKLEDGGPIANWKSSEDFCQTQVKALALAGRGAAFRSLGRLPEVGMR